MTTYWLVAIFIFLVWFSYLVTSKLSQILEVLTKIAEAA